MPKHSVHSGSSSSDRGLFLGLLTLLVLAPLPLGANRVWAWAPLAIAMYLLTAVWGLQFLRGRVVVTRAFERARAPLLLLVAWCVYVGLQLVPMPIEWLQVLSPTAAAHYHHVGATTAPVSVDQTATMFGLLLTLFLVMSYAMTLLLVHSRKRLRILLAVIIASGTAQAVYGSAMVLSGLEWGFFVDKVSYIGAATGTFINKNHLAGYLEMCLGLGLGLMLTQQGRVVGASARAQLVGVLRWLTSWKIMVRLLLVVMVIGLVLSRSRMGNIAFFVGLLSFGVLGLLARRPMPKRPFVILVISVVLIDALVIGKWFGFDEVVERIEQTSISDETRDDVGIRVLPAIQDYWLVGSGLGSFASVFPAYRSEQVRYFWDHAHNDYLQFALEGGAIGSVILAAFLAVSLANGMRRCRHGQSQLRWGLSMGAMMATISLLVHSVADFNLQIPANAMLFMIALSLFWFESDNAHRPG